VARSCSTAGWRQRLVGAAAPTPAVGRVARAAPSDASRSVEMSKARRPGPGSVRL